MQYDFSRIDDIDSFISIPEGRYACRVAEVREGLARDGSPRWSLRLEVTLGEYAGRTAGWDSLTWSERGIRRVKHVLEAFGLDVSGRLEITPADLLGREVVASFQSEEREDAFTGRRVLRLRVPYAGYLPSGSYVMGVSDGAAEEGHAREGRAVRRNGADAHGGDSHGGSSHGGSSHGGSSHGGDARDGDDDAEEDPAVDRGPNRGADRAPQRLGARADRPRDELDELDE